MKTALAILLALAAQAGIRAEGLASWTTVTAKNRDKLPHHSLEVTCKPGAPGVTRVVIYIGADEGHPLEDASVKVFRKESREYPYLAKWQQAISAGKPPHLYFHVADDLLDRVEVAYMLDAGGEQSHRFTIKPGELQKLARLGKPKNP